MSVHVTNVPPVSLGLSTNLGRDLIQMYTHSFGTSFLSPCLLYHAEQFFPGLTILCHFPAFSGPFGSRPEKTSKVAGLQSTYLAVDSASPIAANCLAAKASCSSRAAMTNLGSVPLVSAVLCSTILQHLQICSPSGCQAPPPVAMGRRESSKVFLC